MFTGCRGSPDVWVHGCRGSPFSSSSFVSCWLERYVLQYTPVFVKLGLINPAELKITLKLSKPSKK